MIEITIYLLTGIFENVSMEVMRVKRTDQKIEENVQDSTNVTPRISLNEPVVKKDLKTVIDQIFRFVSVGGDFV